MSAGYEGHPLTKLPRTLERGAGCSLRVELEYELRRRVKPGMSAEHEGHPLYSSPVCWNEVLDVASGSS